MSWKASLIRLLSKKEIEQLDESVLRLWVMVDKATTARNELDSLIEETDRRRTETLRFGPPLLSVMPPIPNYPAMVAMIPVIGMQAHIKVGSRRIAALDLLFLELGGIYGEIARNLKEAGLSHEADRASRLVGTLERWRHSVRERIYPRVPNVIKERSDIWKTFLDKLSAAGLRTPYDNDNPAYMEALMATVQPLMGAEAEVKAPGLGDLGAGPLALAVVGLIKVVAVVAGIVASLVTINAIIRNYRGPMMAAMEAAAELQKRKTIREQAVAAGTMTRAEADAANKADGEATKKDIEKAAEEARKDSLAKLLATVSVIPVVIIGGFVALKALKVI